MPIYRPNIYLHIIISYLPPDYLVPWETPPVYEFTFLVLYIVDSLIGISLV